MIKSSETTLADRIWDRAQKAMVPIGFILGGLLAAHERTLSGHEHRLAQVERAGDRAAAAAERMATALTEIQVLLGRLEERLTALARR